MSTSVELRFWSHVDTTGECWVWVGARQATSGGGYGRLAMRDVRGFHVELAHRVSWQIHNGSIPAGMLVLHTCDNGPCVRPDHLYLGTQKENARDRSARGRHGAWTMPWRFTGSRKRAA